METLELTTDKTMTMPSPHYGLREETIRKLGIPAVIRTKHASVG